MYLLNTKIPEQIQIRKSLTYIYGISNSISNSLCNALGIGNHYKVNEVTNIQLYKIKKILKENFKLNNVLKKEELSDIKRLVEIKAYRGIRHKLCYPVRGQRTHSNARTQKSLGKKRFSLIIK